MAHQPIPVTALSRCCLLYTSLDDYLHVVDTALWLSGGKASLDGGTLLTNDAGEMLFAEHQMCIRDRS